MDGPRDLTEARDRIDALDCRLIDLLAERQGIVEQVGRLKKGQPVSAVRAPDRAAQVIASRRERAVAAGLDPDVAERVWRTMIDAFVDLELRIHEEPA